MLFRSLKRFRIDGYNGGLGTGNARACLLSFARIPAVRASIWITGNGSNPKFFFEEIHEQDAPGLSDRRRRSGRDRKSTRLNSSHRCTSYCVLSLHDALPIFEKVPY